ncbi:hypothetical protein METBISCDRAFT_16720 [Metschnikowia bicuspidata]|uniref:Dolichyl-phosphate-mannose--protein mannosyltransferase n=1 Tax=Metschnikowia bicuspidata TaxID=27322 RepID=A0A4P9ZC51_9ASCO|nr:hypothetical protein METBISCDRAFT_16720 [Metschnikowia bicuspidata]
MAKKSKSGVASVPANDRSRFFDAEIVAEPQFYTGPQGRRYLVTDVPPAVTAARKLGRGDWPLIVSLVMGCIVLRMQNFAHPNSVVFDEVHFGKFAKKYIVGQFFMDVHPPLVKMLFAAVSSLGGFVGNFDFENIGDIYPSDVPYMLMRSFPAVLGSATVVLCYLTLRASGVRPTVAFSTAFCLLVENAFVTISRYILLDAPLMFFIAAAVYAFKKFETQQPFSVDWWRALLACAISLGLALSSKWVGLFTVAWVGVLCAAHMWLYIGDLRVKPAFIVKNAVARASFLLVIPALVYMAMFYVHFMLLLQDSTDSSFYSNAFRAELQGSAVPKDTDASIGYGSIVTIRHMQTKGGYLHSHNHFYPAGSEQQQVTLYPHLDSNNEWLIEPYNFLIPDHFVPITDDTKIRLKHVSTSRRLHSHDEKPPVSERDWQKEVSCYGHDGFDGDANDDWIVEVVKHRTPQGAQNEVKAINTVFRLRHAMSGVYLFSTETKLPDWGFEQQEVTGASQGARPYTHWYIESNTNPYLNVTERVGYSKLTFLQKFVESHKVMWHVNQGLTLHHTWQSQPHEWPFLLRGINYWGKDHTQIYFLGNPLVWWTATACLLGFGFHVLVSVLKWKAGATTAASKAVFNYNYNMFSYGLGWAAHYFPFFVMGRQLFLHHYLPAQYFAILGLGHFFELVVGTCVKYRKHAFLCVTAFLVLAYLAHIAFSPLVDGSQWTKSQCLTVKLLHGWDYDCNTFFDSYAQYELYVPTDILSQTDSAADTSVLIEAESSVQHVSQYQAPPLSQDELESPPPAKTHGGEVRLDASGNVVPPDVVPLGDMYDEGTANGDSAHDKPAWGLGVVVEDVLMDDVVVEDFVVKDAPASSIDLRIEEH